MTYLTTENEGVLHSLRQRLSRRVRQRSQGPPNEISRYSPQHTRPGPSLATNKPTPISQKAKPIASPLPLEKTRNVPEASVTISDHGPQRHTSQSTLHWDSIEHNLTSDRLTLGDGIGSGVGSPDLWSAAYREAVESFGDRIDIAALEGRNASQLFRKLEGVEKEATQDSAFLKGVRCLQSLTGPLEKLKLALDLTSPLASIEPTAATVFGVVRSVTAIAISIATADLEFARQIAEMLEQISWIDGCDTLGQKANRRDIHKALVPVYQKILEFYTVAFEILTRKGAKLVMKMFLENDRLPNIVREFLRCSKMLRIVIENATFEIGEDMKRMLYDSEIDRWLGYDKLSRQCEYHEEWRVLRANEACEFLLKDTDFINWYNAPDSQQLVILGDLGSGKTITMSFLADVLSRRNQHQLPQPKLCYYYCRDDETGKATAIFSALILELLKQLPGLKKPFFEWYKESQASGNYDPTRSPRKLGEFLQNILEEIDRPVFIVIDGLDECDTTSRYNLLKFLKNSSQKIPRLKTLLSCRPQEDILKQLPQVPTVQLGSDVERDSFIVDKTVEMQLCYLSPEVKKIVKDRLSAQAQGSAIWTKMIVQLIQKKDTRAIGNMRVFLENMPLSDKLSDLYDTLLSRCASDDPENEELGIIALKLLTVADRPFSILELAWAVALSMAQHVTTVDALATLVDHERVMSIIHPFVACPDFCDLKKYQVRLVHQSVKEYIIQKWASNNADLQRSAPIPGQCFEKLEAFILDICIRYLLLDDIGERDLFSEELVAISELPQEVDLFTDSQESVEYNPYCTWEVWEEGMNHYDPTERGIGEFFVYASCHWLKHFGAIKVEPLPSLASIENLCQAGSTRLNNWTQQNCRPGCAVMARFEFDSSLYDPLSITSLYGSVVMLRHMLKDSNFDNDKFLQKPAIMAVDQILQWGDVSRLRMLFFHDRLGDQLQNLDFFRLVLKKWHDPNISHDNWDHVFDLVNGVSDRMIQEHWGNELLCLAAGAGCMPIIQRLVSGARGKAELRSELLRGFRYEQWSSLDTPMHPSIAEAILGEIHIEMAENVLRENGIKAHF
ncbi:hypothetical protein N7510_005905 [Penicillium lagena]|uniref:uncharacterized protein n=1 Tax=Penicillium lagena TaxID=94218 RepID=UPI002540B97D|nr:uncharacterized protein N7510_005905 [Penicillium lagena]KAJ5612711.1 hypothetical protein N7510_005905 [Penicillium lagena]